MKNWIDLKVNGDERGKLIAIEGNKDFPFEIKRLFYIYDTESDTIRGAHANKFSSFAFICLTGSCKITLDDGFEKKVYHLSSPSKALYCPKGVWKEMSAFSEGTVLLVVSDQLYNASEYIREYTEFKEYCKRYV